MVDMPYFWVLYMKEVTIVSALFVFGWIVTSLFKLLARIEESKYKNPETVKLLLNDKTSRWWKI